VAAEQSGATPLERATPVASDLRVRRFDGMNAGAPDSEVRRYSFARDWQPAADPAAQQSGPAVGTCGGDTYADAVRPGDLWPVSTFSLTIAWARQADNRSQPRFFGASADGLHRVHVSQPGRLSPRLWPVSGRRSLVLPDRGSPADTRPGRDVRRYRPRSSGSGLGLGADSRYPGRYKSPRAGGGRPGRGSWGSGDGGL